MYSEKTEERIFGIVSREDFFICAMETFRYQYEECKVYREFADALSFDPGSVRVPEDIPFMPIQFFKSREVIPEGMQAELEFHSSGTTGMQPGRHLVADARLYEKSLARGFEYSYGDPASYTFLALTPGPEDNPLSSLVYMINFLMKQSPVNPHGFFTGDQPALKRTLDNLNGKNRKIILIGLTYALLDFSESYPGEYPGLIVMETGGMKGRREEITRDELHEKLRSGFSGAEIHSEYGMTELLSQAYSLSDGRFRCPPWMQVFIRELNDPFTAAPSGRTGGISIIDLANLYSCSFIATQDLGRKHRDGSFEVLGRFDASDLRGCSLMLEG